MRQGVLFWILLLVLMSAALAQCRGCGKSFNNSNGLSNHHRKCTARLERINERARKKRAVGPAGLAQSSEHLRSANETADEHFEPSQPDLLTEAPPVPGPSVVLPPRESIAPTSSGRVRTRPGRYRDYLPSSRTQMPHLPPPPPPRTALRQQPAAHQTPPPPDLPSDLPLTTEPDSFGRYRVYPMKPSRQPDDDITLQGLCDSPGLAGSATKSSPPPQSVYHLGSSFAPFKNLSVSLMMHWTQKFATVSYASIKALVQDVLLAPGFKTEDLQGFNAKREARRLDEHVPLASKDGWKEGSVELPLPAQDLKQTEDAAPKLKVDGVWYRSLRDVIISAFKEPVSSSFYNVPWKQFWRRDKTSEPERVYSETYSSDSVNEEYERLRGDPRIRQRHPGIEIVIASLMLWSDSTHLTSFGPACLWPIYLYFGNLSKYARAKPSQFAAHHVAYIPGLPHNIQDTYHKLFGKIASSELLTHLKRELFQAIWFMLLDADFMDAYMNGILIICADGVTRLVFPRFTTYAADYPEQVLIACIKSLSTCLCPTCLAKDSQVHEMGTKADMRRREKFARVDDHARRSTIETVRRWIFEGFSIVSKRVKDLLSMKSWTATKASCMPTSCNAFSERLSSQGVNFYEMITPDVLHGFELGVWKSTFAHLVRLLHVLKGTAIATLDRRFRLVPTFGRDTIRRFTTNMSEMKKLAGRDFEDCLQCAIPVFEGLFPEPHNTIVLSMLFVLAEWHAFAKLRVHTESTLSSFEACTALLGKHLRKFAKTTCKAWTAYELPREESARIRRQTSTSNTGKVPGRPRGRNIKKYNMSTSKLHSLGHYPRVIRRKGTTDNYNTQTGELEHRRAKRFYRRTNRRKVQQQIAKHTKRERLLHNISQATNSGRSVKRPAIGRRNNLKFVAASVSKTSPAVHHYISKMTKRYMDIFPWLQKNAGDPALPNFLMSLRNHLLSRLLYPENGDGPLTNSDLTHLIIVKNRLFLHQVMRVNYTTYDVRRNQDSINVRAHPDLMMLNPSGQGDDHPFLYARVLGVMHANVRYRGDEHRMELLWVRWFELDTSRRTGWDKLRLHRLRFVEGNDERAFGFVDPTDVIRAVHLIPAFHHGKTSQYLGPSTVRSLEGEDQDEDWKYYYVNMFVDRDMFMRFRGGGIGHIGVHFPISQDDAASDEEDEGLDEEGENTAEAPEGDAPARTLDANDEGVDSDADDSSYVGDDNEEEDGMSEDDEDELDYKDEGAEAGVAGENAEVGEVGENAEAGEVGENAQAGEAGEDETGEDKEGEDKMGEEDGDDDQAGAADGYEVGTQDDSAEDDMDSLPDVYAEL